MGDISHGLMGLFCLRELQLRWAAANGDEGSPAMMWSAVNGSCAPLSPPPQRWQATALALTALALRL